MRPTPAIASAASSDRRSRAIRRQDIDLLRAIARTCDYLIAGGLSYEDRHHWSDEGMVFFGQRLMHQPAMQAALAEVTRRERPGDSAN